MTPMPPTSSEIAATVPRSKRKGVLGFHRRLKKRGHVAHAEVFGLVARLQQCLDALLGGVDLSGVFDFDRDAAEIILAEEPHQAGGDRHENDIVLIAAVGRGAFFGHHADDEERHAFHQHVFADRTIAVGKERFRHRAAEHDDGGVVFHVVGVEKLSFGHRPIARRGEVFAGSLHRGLIIDVAETHGGPAVALGQRGFRHWAKP